ncbi:ubiquinol-cytochrome C chaperone family protein [Phenylobacterium sp.]|uniref:ubiquinol-cytochrome C chaperone family protein n=1 Tax=Phenylobacterium sp. TaxID=1871053 RepID=UPI00272F3A29|nr:ubiquinol-cytochrome C chaperone family protein [Phenylobacterium sp.]MDP2212665.1 ubiquinol-cytochrome C chaperone family protein [Phenylobacterium sp.]
MILERLFRPKPARIAGQKLYAEVVTQARSPEFYGRLAAPDTVEGRFELYSLHVVLLLDRLKRQGAPAADTAQALFDAYISALDDALREMGVGDLSVGKKMRKLGEAFYGRVKSYETALSLLPDEAPLAALIARTVYAEAEGAPVEPMVAYVLRQRQTLAELPLETILAGDIVWAAP